MHREESAGDLIKQYLLREERASVNATWAWPWNWLAPALAPQFHRKKGYRLGRAAVANRWPPSALTFPSGRPGLPAGRARAWAATAAARSNHSSAADSRSESSGSEK